MCFVLQYVKDSWCLSCQSGDILAFDVRTFISAVMQRHLQWIGVEVSIHQSILYVLMHFIRAWYDAHIVVSCEHTQWGPWNTCVQGWDYLRLTSTTPHGQFYYSHATHKLWLFGQREKCKHHALTYVNLDMSCTAS